MRLGRIPWINCYPVYGAIDRGIVPVPAELVTGTASELNDLLAAGELDVSAVSAVEYARNAAAYHLLPDLAITCDGPLLLTARGDYPIKLDLGAEWHTWTGLPFVFAVWAARRSAPAEPVRAVHSSLLDSRAWGLDHLDELAADAALRTGVDEAVCRAYLGDLDYALSYRHLAGLTDFFRRLAQDGLVPDGSLSFISAA
jgi:predicted solute-binding protein